MKIEALNIRRRFSKFTKFPNKTSVQPHHEFPNGFRIFHPAPMVLALAFGFAVFSCPSFASAQVSILLKPTNIFSLAFSPDGKSISSGNGDGRMRSWEVATGKHLRTLGNEFWPITSLAYSPDGKFLVSGGMDKKVKSWGVDTGREVLIYGNNLQSKDFYSVAFSPDGKILVSGNGSEVIVWNAATGKAIGAYSGHSSDVTSSRKSLDILDSRLHGNDGKKPLNNFSTPG
ncbi:MAG: hypothetical protein HZA02_01215 [Nitrospinae bacterium]|nr:hypothetical protein [Nitrospinota bacterium]